MPEAPLLSLTLVAMVTCPDTVAPLAGLVMASVGAVLSLATVTDNAVETFELLAAS